MLVLGIGIGIGIGIGWVGCWCSDSGLWLDFPLTSLLKLQFWFRVAAASTAHVAQGVKVTNRRPRLWREQLDAAFPPLPLPIHLPLHTPWPWTMKHVPCPYWHLRGITTTSYWSIPSSSPSLAGTTSPHPTKTTCCHVQCRALALDPFLAVVVVRES
jgi:hypothetical protein